MAKIKVGDLKELNKQVVDIKEVEYQGLNLEVKQYIPILDKIGFTSGIAKGCINRKDGLFIVNNSSKKIAFSNAIIENYTNLTLPKSEGESGIEAFDLISRSGVLDIVLENIPRNELLTLHELLENKITEERDKYNQEIAKYNQDNTLENVVKNGIDSLLFTLDNFMGGKSEEELIELVKKAIDELDPKKLKFIQDFIKANSGAE